MPHTKRVNSSELTECSNLNKIDKSKKSELLKLFNEMVFVNTETDFNKVIEILEDFDSDLDSDECKNFIEYVKQADTFKNNLFKIPNAEGFINDLKDFILKRNKMLRLIKAADIAHNHKRYNASRHTRRLSSMASYNSGTFGKIRKKSKRGKDKKKHSLRKEKRKNGKTRGKKKKN